MRNTQVKIAARIVSGKRKFDHISPVLQDLHWLPVSYMLRYRDGVMTFKCLNGLAPSYLSNKFNTRSEIHDCNTRNRDMLDVPLCRTAVGQRSFLFRAVSLWNDLPNSIKNITDINIFKASFKRMLQDECWSVNT